MICESLKIMSAVREVSGYTKHALGGFGSVNDQGRETEKSTTLADVRMESCSH